MNDIFVYLARLENVDGREKLKHYHNFQLTNYLIIYFSTRKQSWGGATNKELLQSRAWAYEIFL